MEMEKGEILELLGPSGSGTLVRSITIMGMLTPKKGKIMVLGESIPNRELLMNIGYMAQSDALYGNWTALENLKFFTTLMGLKNSIEAIMHAAKVVKLDNHLSDNVNSFSGGMKRRLSLAIALVPNPKLLILD